MDYIQPLLTTPASILALALAFALYASIRRQPPRPRNLNSSPFTQLPYEIIEHIASFLPSAAAASFASTCVCIRLATGTQYLSALRASPTERLALLELLLADTPNGPIHNIPSRLLCTHCVRLVPINVGCGPSAKPACRETWEISKNHIDSSFSPPFFHTIMAMHRHGHETDELLSRISPPTYTTYDSNTRVASQHRLRYKITDEGSLILRTQANYILPHPDVDGQTYPLSQLFCGHFGGHTSPMDKDVALVQTKVYEGNTWSKSKFWSCPTCPTVAMVGARKFRGRGIGLFTTWWKDLGDGRADQKWLNIASPVVPVPPGQTKTAAYRYLDVVNGFEEGNTDYFDFDGLVSPADRKELFRLCPYKVGSGK
ncbi:hypothetical protein V490_01466 [Pseudogymnoascus sp. VKM F-3557]|nr:hypothetical protein V490_01466 [Pseudogymnoascus sp. VKM F-3557]